MEKEFNPSDVSVLDLDRGESLGGGLRRQLLESIVQDYPCADQAGEGGLYEDIKNAKLIFDIDCLYASNTRGINGVPIIRTYKDAKYMIVNKLLKLGYNIEEAKGISIDPVRNYKAIRVRIKDNIKEK